MHKGTPSSNAIRAIAIIICATSILFCMQGILTDYELFSVYVAGVDAFIGIYLVGIVSSFLTLYGVFTTNRKLEYFGMTFNTWLYTFIGLFTLVVSYLQSPFIAVCFCIAVINGIISVYVKERKVEERNSHITA